MSQSDFVTRGQALVASGQYQEAVKVCRLGLLGRPTTVDGRIVLGQALLALKRYDEVLAEMRVALELDHGSAVAQAIKGEALIRKGDPQGAVEVLTEVVAKHPNDARARELLGAARAAIPAKGARSSAPAVNYVGGASGAIGDEEIDAGDLVDSTESIEPDNYNETRNYAGRAPDGPHGIEDSGGGSTRPITPGKIASPTPAPSALAALRGPAKPDLAIGDRSGTLEVDPALDGVQVDDDDFGALAAPPRAGAGARGADFAEPRGSIKRASVPRVSKADLKKPKKDATSVELDSDELIEVVEAPVARVRNAVNVPAGKFPDVPSLAGSPFGPKAGPQAATMPAAPARPGEVAQSPAAVRPTLALPLYPDEPTPSSQAPAWAKATVVAAQPLPQTAQEQLGGIPGLIDALERPSVASMPSNAFPPSENSASRPIKAGIRKGRSRFRMAGWIVVGGLVIGGGVFAGFQIRAMRLAKQIEAARVHATDSAKADTWHGWLAARDSLGGIAQASTTIENKAAVARVRGVLAYEFGDALPEAKLAADAVGDKDGLDGALAAAYVALASDDEKQAKLAIEHAKVLASDDAATLYVTGQLALVGGDVKGAIKNLTDAAAKDDRPLYHVALARAYAAIEAWDAANASLKRALELSKDNPAALVERALVTSASGAPGDQAKRDLEDVLAEAARPVAEQTRGVSPYEAALARVALARLELAQGDREAALKDTTAALGQGVDDPRLAELVCETLLLAGSPLVGDATKLALQRYPESRRVHVVVAEDLVVHGRAGEALDYVAGKGDRGLALPRGLAVRGQAKLVTGDPDGARADFEAALKLAPQLELAVVGRAQIDLARGDLDAAAAVLEPRLGKSPSGPLAIAMAQVLRARGTAAGRDHARELLEKVVARAGGDSTRATIELATLQSEAGAAKDARAALAPLVKAGNVDARLANALILIDDGDPAGGHTELESLVRDAGPKPPMMLALEAARARTLVGDHAGATQLLDGAEKMPGVTGWKLDRERARLYFRKGDVAKAGEVIARALATSGTDLDTLVLAADIAYADLQTDNTLAALVEQVKTVATQRLVRELDGPERAIVGGKLGLAQGLVAEAEDAYKVARAGYAAHKSTRRRMAQVDFGFAVAAVDRNDLPAARDLLENVEVQDPTLYDAFLFHAHIALANKDAKKALELARVATRLDPDSVQAWHMLGLAARDATGQGRTLAEAMAKLGELAPRGDELKELQQPKR